MLRPFAHPIACCCELLTICSPLQHGPNKTQHCRRDNVGSCCVPYIVRRQKIGDWLLCSLWDIFAYSCLKFKPIDRFHMTSRRPYLCTKQWMAAMFVYKKFCGNWTPFTCKNFLLFQAICKAADHVTENDLYIIYLTPSLKPDETGFMFDCCSVRFLKARLCLIAELSIVFDCKILGWVRLSSITEPNRSQSNNRSSIWFGHRTFDWLRRAITNAF